jgi:hypothetical protein
VLACNYILNFILRILIWMYSFLCLPLCYDGVRFSHRKINTYAKAAVQSKKQLQSSFYPDPLSFQHKHDHGTDLACDIPDPLKITGYKQQVSGIIDSSCIINHKMEQFSV